MSRNCVTHHYACDCREEKFSQIEKENTELKEKLVHHEAMSQGIWSANNGLKARLAHVESELEKSDEVLMHYACYETQYASDNEPPCVRDGDGRVIDDYEYSQGHFKQFGKRSRQRIKERKEFE